MAKSKRDSDYYLKRLETEHPAIFDGWKGGKYSSARKALEAAGLRTPTKALAALKAAWTKASVKDRADFLLWAGPPASTRVPTILLDKDRRLTPAAAANVRTIMTRRGMRMGDVMSEMGLSRLNPSLGNALGVRPTRLEPELAKKLGKWIEDDRKGE